ncbi:MAG: amidase, partial [Cereibacter sp.]
MTQGYGADATETARHIARGDVSPEELLDAALAAVDRINPVLNAVVLVQEGAARKAIAEGLPRGPFRGVPILGKDLGGGAGDVQSLNGSRLRAWSRSGRG